jgi:hypothetical protein
MRSHCFFQVRSGGLNSHLPDAVRKMESRKSFETKRLLNNSKPCHGPKAKAHSTDE